MGVRQPSPLADALRDVRGLVIADALLQDLMGIRIGTLGICFQCIRGIGFSRFRY